MNTFKRNLIIGYSISFLLLIIGSIASYISIQKLLAGQKLVNHTNEVIKRLNGITMSIKDGESGQRGFLLTNEEAFLTPYKAAYENANSLVQQIKTLTADNHVQQQNVNLLKSLVNERFGIMQNVVEVKNRTGQVSAEQLERGRQSMSRLTTLISKMVDIEQALLRSRNETMNRLASITPPLVVIASLLALIVTVISFLKVNADFEKRRKLQEEVEQKNEEISKRIQIIENIAGKISSGNFSTRVANDEKESLGVLALSLNKMAESLEYSFHTLSGKEWHQSGIAQLNDLMIGETDLEALTTKAIDFITVYTKSQVGAFYLTKDENTLVLSSGYAIERNRIKKEVTIGEGIAGQSALSKKKIIYEQVSTLELLINYSGGVLKPNTIIAVPVFYESTLKGVIELATVGDYSDIIHQFVESAVYNIGIAIHSARDHQRLQELLDETQAQSEELQSQHSELENVNAELEAQAEKLQASEEELKVQHEELQEANGELQERSRLLEEKNEAILERNLEIQKKAEELAVSTRYKSEFLANMSHELRTPLNSILLLSRLLSENHQNNLSSDQIEYANVIQSSGAGLLMLIDEILDLSKIESGKMDLEISEVNLEGLANEIRSLFEPLATEKGLDFSIVIQKDALSTIQTDRLRVVQILRNLISNALKFTKKGSVIVTARREEESLALSVKDTGIGIPKDKHQTIFEAFQQADGSTRRQYGGTGLGLSISKELAKLLGGEIKLESIEGKGSEFTLLLPLNGSTVGATSNQASRVTEDAEVREQPERRVSIQRKYIADIIPPSIADDRSAVLNGDKCILIIEDDTAFAKSLLDYTRSKGYKGIVAVRGDEGIDLARKFKPHGILLDVQLPVKSGWEVMDELKVDSLTKHIPVHMMSSYEVKDESLAKGAIDFINKPVAAEQLGDIFRKIEQALSSHPRKVLIVEENTSHAQALAYFLATHQVTAEITKLVGAAIDALKSDEADCIILDMGIPAELSNDILEDVKKTPGMENLPIIVFTGKNLSHAEEMKIKRYADSIVVKTAHSYQRILDEVSLFLHLVEENKKSGKPAKHKRLRELSDVLRGKKVLVADDDVRNIFSLTKSLENYGMEVISAIDGKDALKQMEENERIDLVLMDMMMPELDGYESTRRIRENVKYRNLPVIAVTAKAMTGDREKCIAAGASDYITKPVDVDQLLSLLRVWLY